MKALEDHKSNVAILMIFVIVTVENIEEEGENAGYRHFLFFQQCFPKPAFYPFPIMFSKAFFIRVAKNQDCVVQSLAPFARAGLKIKTGPLSIFIIQVYYTSY